MAEKPRCPECGSGQVYRLVGGKLVCRACGYDERTAKEKVKENDQTHEQD